MPTLNPLSNLIDQISSQIPNTLSKPNRAKILHFSVMSSIPTVAKLYDAACDAKVLTYNVFRKRALLQKAGFIFYESGMKRFTTAYLGFNEYRIIDHNSNNTLATLICNNHHSEWTLKPYDLNSHCPSGRVRISCRKTNGITRRSFDISINNARGFPEKHYHEEEPCIRNGRMGFCFGGRSVIASIKNTIIQEDSGNEVMAIRKVGRDHMQVDTFDGVMPEILVFVVAIASASAPVYA